MSLHQPQLPSSIRHVCWLISVMIFILKIWFLIITVYSLEEHDVLFFNHSLTYPEEYSCIFVTKTKVLRINKTSEHIQPKELYHLFIYKRENFTVLDLIII